MNKYKIGIIYENIIKEIELDADTYGINSDGELNVYKTVTKEVKGLFGIGKMKDYFFEKIASFKEFSFILKMEENI